MTLQCLKAQKYAYGLRRDGYTLILVCGPRDLHWPDSDFDKKMRMMIRATLRRQPKAKIAIIVGDARGIDTQAYYWAKDKYPVVIFDAPWKQKRHNAGPYRNNLMIDVVDYHIAFWDGKSPGTKHCKDRAIQEKIPRKLFIRVK